MHHPIWPEPAGSGSGRPRIRPAAVRPLRATVNAFGRFADAGAYCLIASVFGPLGILAKRRVRMLLLGVTLLGTAFPVAKELGYREDAGSLGSNGGLPISLLTLGLIGLYAPLLVSGRREIRPRSRRRFHPGVPLVLYVVFASLSLFAARDAVLGFYEIFLLLETLALYFYIFNFLSALEDISFVFRTLLIGLAAQGLLMIALAAAPGTFSLVGSETRNLVEADTTTVSRYFHVLGVLKLRVDEDSAKGTIRVGGAVGSPNDAAGYLCTSLLAALGVRMAADKRRDRLLAALALLLGGCGLLLTLSRGGWAAFVFGLAVVGLFKLRAGGFSRKTLAAAAVTVAVAGIFFSGTIRSRLESDDEGSAASRVPLMKLAALMIEDHPILGVGANNFPLAMEPYLTRGFSGEWIYAVHNKYLLVWSETGTLALAAFLWFLISAIRSGIRCWRYRQPLLSPLALGFMAAVAASMLHMWVDTFRGLPAMHFLAIAAGLLAVMERSAADRVSGPVKPRTARIPAPARFCESTNAF